VRDGKERDWTERDLFHTRSDPTCEVGYHMRGLVHRQPDRSASDQLGGLSKCLSRYWCRISRTHPKHNRRNARGARNIRGTQVAASVFSRRHWPGRGDKGMLETIAIILIILWLLGMVSGYTLGNFIWVLLVIAVVLFLVRLVSGRRVV